MSISRAALAVGWAVAWTAIFWVGHRSPWSIVGIAGCLVWVIGGARITARGEWHTFAAGLRAREAARAAAYLAAALAVVVILFSLDTKHWLPTWIRVGIIVSAGLPTLLFLPSWLKADTSAE
jgi:hypothetical protein